MRPSAGVHITTILNCKNVLRNTQIGAKVAANERERLQLL